VFGGPGGPPNIGADLNTAIVTIAELS